MSGAAKPQRAVSAASSAGGRGETNERAVGAPATHATSVADENAETATRTRTTKAATTTTATTTLRARTVHGDTAGVGWSAAGGAPPMLARGRGRGPRARRRR